MACGSAVTTACSGWAWTPECTRSSEPPPKCRRLLPARLTLPGHGPFTVLSVDQLLGRHPGRIVRRRGPAESRSIHGARLSRVTYPSRSTPGRKVPVAMAPDVSESEIWVATPSWADTHLARHLVTARVPVRGDQGPTPEVTAMTAGGKGNARVVVSLLPGGLEVADWDKKDGRLENWRPPSPPTGTTRSCSRSPCASAMCSATVRPSSPRRKGSTA